MANLRLTDAAVNAVMDALPALVDAGAAGGTINIYDGTQPATAGTAIVAQVLLATLTFSAASFAAAVAGVSTAAAIADDISADATGTATWARLRDSNGVDIFDCDVNTTGATINLNSVALTLGGTVSISSFTLTHPTGV